MTNPTDIARRAQQLIDDPLVQEFMEKLQPVADMVNGLIERMQERN